MHQDLKADEYEKMLNEKLLEQVELHPDDKLVQTVDIDPNTINAGAELVLEQLH
jgi:hypothetical protein